MLWRVRTGHRLEVSQSFEDGSYLADVYDPANRQRDHGMMVPVIEYMLGAGARHH